MEPMAARLVDDPSNAEGMRQRLQQCVCVSPWHTENLYRSLATKLVRELPDVEAFCVG